MRRLLDVLREDLGLTGTKEGCGEGECGACSVLLDGEVVDSCLVPVCQVEGASVRTVEGLGHWRRASNVLQAAFLETGGAQCGICTPGMLMAGARPSSPPAARPSDEAIREAIAGNLCRCTGYTKIVEAIALAAQRRRAGLSRMPNARRAAGRLPRTAWPRRTRCWPPSTARPDRRRHRPDGPDHRRAGRAAGARPRHLARSTSCAASAIESNALVHRRADDLRRDPPLPARAPSSCRPSPRPRRPSARRRSRTAARSAGTSSTPRPPATRCRSCSPPTPSSSLGSGARRAAGARRRLLARVPADRAARRTSSCSRIRIPLAAGRQVRFRKVGTRRAQAISKVVMALAWQATDDGPGSPWRDVRLALGSVAATPIRAGRTEASSRAPSRTRRRPIAPPRRWRRDPARSTTCAPPPTTGAPWPAASCIGCSATRAAGDVHRAAERHRHAPVHRHRGLDPAAPAARRRATPRCSPSIIGCSATAFEAHGGREVDAAGDGLFVAFAQRPRRGGGRGRGAARARASSRGRAATRCRVRMGMHTGEPLSAGGGYVGLDVHRAARICSAGHGGQILVSADDAVLLGAETSRPAVALRDLGEHRLRDLASPGAALPARSAPGCPPTSRRCGRSRRCRTTCRAS